MSPRRSEDPEDAARRALAAAERKAGSRPEDISLQLRLAESSLRLGDVLQQQGLGPAAGRCFERARRVAETQLERARSAAHDGDGSERGRAPDAVEEARRLVADAKLALGGNLQQQGRHDEAVSCLRDVLELLGPLPADVASADRGHAERIGHAHGNLAIGLDESGHADDAFGHYRISLNIAEAIDRAHRDQRARAALALAHNAIAHHYSETDRLVDAAFHHEASRAINAELHGADPRDDHAQYCLATDHENLCDLACRAGDLEKGLQHANTALELRATLCDRHGAGAAAEWLELLADSYRDVAELLQDLGRGADAVRMHHATRRVAERLRATWPEHEDYQFRVADALLTLGYAQEENGELEEALATYRAALAADRELVETNPTETRWHANAAHCELAAALVLLRLGRFEEAQRSIDSGLAILDAQLRTHPRDRGLLHDLSRFHADLANAWLSLAERASAEHHLRASLKIDRRILQDAPADEHSLAHLAITYDNLAALREEAGDHEGARKFSVLAVRAEESLVAKDPESGEYLLRLAQASLNLAGVLHALDMVDEAFEALGKAQKVQTRLQRLTPDDDEVRSLGGQVLRLRGVLLRDQEDLDGAKQAMDRAVQVFEELLRRRAPVHELDNHLANALEVRLETALDEAEGSVTAPYGDELLADLARRAVAARRRMAEERTGDVLVWRDLARVLDLAAEGYEMLSRYDEARALRDESESIQRRYGSDP